jgi:excinuclease UvrABC ATPase subunit
VGTITEVYDYPRVLYAKMVFSTVTSAATGQRRLEEIAEEVLRLPRARR